MGYFSQKKEDPGRGKKIKVSLEGEKKPKWVLAQKARKLQGEIGHLTSGGEVKDQDRLDGRQEGIQT